RVGSAARALDGYGLCDQLPARPTGVASIRFLYVRPRLCYPLPSDAASRRRPCVLANPSPPSGWIGDLHPQAVDHARHTTKPLRGSSSALPSQDRGVWAEDSSLASAQCTSCASSRSTADSFA